MDQCRTGSRNIKIAPPKYSCATSAASAIGRSMSRLVWRSSVLPGGAAVKNGRAFFWRCFSLARSRELLPARSRSPPVAHDPQSKVKLSGTARDSARTIMHFRLVTSLDPLRRPPAGCGLANRYVALNRPDPDRFLAHVRRGALSLGHYRCSDSRNSLRTADHTMVAEAKAAVAAARKSAIYPSGLPCSAANAATECVTPYGREATTPAQCESRSEV